MSINRSEGSNDLSKIRDSSPEHTHSLENTKEDLSSSLLLDNLISFITPAREALIEKLPRNTQDQLFYFLKKHKEISRLVNELNNLIKSKGDAYKIDRGIGRIALEIETLCDEYEEDGFNSECIEVIGDNLELSALERKFYFEQSITRFVDMLAYKQEIEEFIKLNRELIIHEFCPEKHRKDALNYCKIETKLFGRETHNHGRITAFVTFYLYNPVGENERIFQIVYNPRDAQIDKAVMSALWSWKRSLPFFLPDYKILNFDNENVSIWEYVEGSCLLSDETNSWTKGQFIRSGKSGLKDESKNKALSRLSQMDAILTMMGISDLHRENVLIKNLFYKDEEVEFSPIDLENFSIGKTTELGGFPKNTKLTVHQKKIIQTYLLNKTNNLICRYIPLPTQVMAGMTGTPNLYKALAYKLMDEFQTDKLIVIMKLSSLEENILISMLHHDVLYFTELSGKIYYGMPNEGKIIAIREED